MSGIIIRLSCYPIEMKLVLLLPSKRGLPSMRSRTPADDIPHQTPELCEFQLDVLGKSDDLGASISCFYKDFLSYSMRRAGLAIPR